MSGEARGTVRPGHDIGAGSHRRWWVSVPIFLAGTLVLFFELDLRFSRPGSPPEECALRPLTVLVEGRWDSLHALAQRVSPEPPPLEPAPRSEPVRTTPAPERPSPGPESYVEYRVKKGDSLWRIAARELGDGERWTQIAALNPRAAKRPTQLKHGAVLRLPNHRGEAQARTSRRISAG